MCGGSAPKTANVDPEAERREAEAEATAKANHSILAGARRKRGQQGLLSSEAASSSVLASASAGDMAGSVAKAARKSFLGR